MNITRRTFAKFVAGAGVAAAVGQLARTATASYDGGYRAMVGVFLFGGNDGWNMVVPTDARYAGYAASRGSVALPQAKLTALNGSAFALHPSMHGALGPVWNEGGLGLVLNSGTLYAPLTKELYRTRTDLRPSNLLSHSDEQAHWQGLRARAPNFDGFMGRIADRSVATPTPALISLGGSNLAVIGQRSSPLILPSTGTLGRTGYSNGSTPKNAAIDAFASGAGLGGVAEVTARQINEAYDQAAQTNAILGASSGVDAHFVNTTTGARLSSDVSRQLLRVARLIEARSTLGHQRQTFFVTQGGYDTHASQVNGDNSTGQHANMLGDLAQALAAFYRAIKAMGLGPNVTAFTMSDFGRTFRGNSQNGTDHAWGSNHLVVGGALNPALAHGLYPDTTLGGADDVSSEGRFLPTIAQEEYLGAVARWHGVADADMGYIFPNWSTWTTGGRAPLGLFRA